MMMTSVAFTYEASKRSFSLRGLTYDVGEEVSDGDVESEPDPGAELAEEGLVEGPALIPGVVLIDSPLLRPARCKGM